MLAYDHNFCYDIHSNFPLIERSSLSKGFSVWNFRGIFRVCLFARIFAGVKIPWDSLIINSSFKMDHKSPTLSNYSIEKNSLKMALHIQHFQANPSINKNSPQIGTPFGVLSHNWIYFRNDKHTSIFN